MEAMILSKLVFDSLQFVRNHWFAVRRWIYKEKKFREDIAVDVCNNSDAITIDMSESNPCIRIAFDIENKSEYLDIIFDRAEVSISVGYQIPGKIQIVMPHEIKKRSKHYLPCELILNPNQYGLIRRCLEQNKGIEKVNIDIDYYIKSNLYNFTHHKRLDNKGCRVINYKTC